MWYKKAKFDSEINNIDKSNDPDSVYMAIAGFVFSMKQKTSDLQKISDALRSYKNKLIAEGKYTTETIEDAYDSVVDDENLPTSESKLESDTNLRFIKPLEGDITSNFGPRDAPMEGASTNHQGVDIDGNEGDFVVASEGGTVTYAGTKGSYGNLVIIDHGGGYETYYAHLSSFEVNNGDEVMQNRVIGKVGKTGRATGPHLHFELRLNGSPISPNF